MTQVGDPWGGTTSFKYDLDGDPLRTTYPNGAIEDRTYEPRNRLTSIAEISGGGVPYDVRTYAYRAGNGGSSGQVISEGSALQSVRTYGYDHLERLTSGSLTAPPETIGYGYDPNGNRTQAISRILTTPGDHPPNSTIRGRIFSFNSRDSLRGSP